MRIVLCYPPLLPSDSAAALAAQDDEDNTRVPLGLYSLAAVLRERGHDVSLHNLALTPWSQAVDAIADARPELFGVTCYTFHRHTVARLTREVRARCPDAHLIVGGPHATPLPLALLERWPWIDSVAVGEAEVSLPELVDRLAAGDDPAGVRGIAHRDGDGVPVFPGPAETVRDLDQLPIAARHWRYDIVATSRGCPFDCTFCASSTLWGRNVRLRSPAHVIQELELLRQQGVTQVAFKDETFTFKRQRVIELCQAMIDARLNLWWTCDTRANCLDEERLSWMRRAGCFQISLGAESGSPEVLATYDKRGTPEKVVEATALARKFGLYVRHYYIAGAPSETEATLRQSVDLIERSRPQRVFVSPLSVAPGTRLYRELAAERGWDDSLWFDRREEWVLARTDATWTRWPAWKKLAGYRNSGKETARSGLLFPLTIEELQAAAARVPDAFAVHYDLAQALLAEGRDAEAADALARAVEANPDAGKAWIDLADCLRRLERPAEALTALERVAAIALPSEATNQLVALLRRAELLRAAGRPGEAVNACLQVIQREPRAGEAYDLGTTVLLESGRMADAEAVATAWVRALPDAAGGYRVLAAGRFTRGDLAAAATFFGRAAELDPGNRETLNNLTIVLARLGRVAEARECARRCLAQHPGDPAAQRLHDQLGA